MVKKKAKAFFFYLIKIFRKFCKNKIVYCIQDFVYSIQYIVSCIQYYVYLNKFIKRGCNL